MTGKFTTGRAAEHDRDLDVVDRAWAATRPAPPPAETVGRIWAAVERQPVRARSIAGARSSRLKFVGLSGAALAFAASMVAMVWFGVRNGGATVPDRLLQAMAKPNMISTPTTPAPGAPAAIASRYEIEVDELVMIEIGEAGVKDHRTKPESGPANLVAYGNVPAGNASDILGVLETISP